MHLIDDDIRSIAYTVITRGLIIAYWRRRGRGTGWLHGRHEQSPLCGYNEPTLVDIRYGAERGARRQAHRLGPHIHTLVQDRVLFRRRSDRRYRRVQRVIGAGCVRVFQFLLKLTIPLLQFHHFLFETLQLTFKLVKFINIWFYHIYTYLDLITFHLWVGYIPKCLNDGVQVNNLVLRIHQIIYPFNSVN